MGHDPPPPRRQPIRLRHYDHATPGAYFATVCVQNRMCLFGEIVDVGMVPNDAGLMVERWWLELANKFPGLQIDEYVVMRNHFHGILIIDTAAVGAALRGRPNPDEPPGHPKGRPRRGAPTVGDAVGWFKTMTTNRYIQGVKDSGWAPFPRRLWQRNYYEHVVRDQRELDRIREYTVLNPARWAQDAENPEAVRKPADAPWKA